MASETQMVKYSISSNIVSSEHIEQNEVDVRRDKIRIYGKSLDYHWPLEVMSCSPALIIKDFYFISTKFNKNVLLNHETFSIPLTHVDKRSWITAVTM